MGMEMRGLKYVEMRGLRYVEMRGLRYVEMRGLKYVEMRGLCPAQNGHGDARALSRAKPKKD